MTKRNFMEATDTCQRLQENIARVIKGQDDNIKKTIAVLLAGGHVLLEDVPGTGKTTLAKALALSINARYQRIQFTPDLLPGDILGVTMFDADNRAFTFHEGPVFTNILLADEINRASPRTQSALLEAMAESQVSIEGKVFHLQTPFFVIATQNPVDFHGTYPLPEAQMDRFSIRLSLGYISSDDEARILEEQNDRHPLEMLKACTSLTDILSLREQVASIRVSDTIKAYIIELVRTTRDYPGVILGASPRASLALMKVAQSMAVIEGLQYISPDHVQAIAVDVLAHRIIIDSQSRFSGVTAEALVNDVLRSIPVPT